MRSSLAAIAGLAALCGLTRATDTESAIKLDCASEWPRDYAMQEYCFERQARAYSEMYSQVYKAERNQDEDLILYTCLEEWKTANGQDWAMVQYCYRRQHEAYIRLKAAE
jgi:hypothetical protein